MKKLTIILACLLTFATAGAQDNWYQYGFKIGTSFPTARDYSYEGHYLSGLANADFGIFFRAGKYVYGEVGFGYAFFRGDYNFYAAIDSLGYRDERASLHYLQIPIKIAGYVPLSRSVSLIPQAGIIYQPLVNVSDNSINFNKNTLTNHPLLLTGGIDFKFGPIIIGVNYRYQLQNFFQNKDGKRPQFINICAGVQL